MSNKELFPYKINGLDQRKGVEYVECRGVVVAHITSLEEIIDNEMKSPARIDSFITIICLRGSVTFSSYLTEYTLTENTLFVAPSTMLQFKHCTPDSDLFILAFDNDFASEMNIDIRVMMPVMSALRQNCVLINIEKERSARMTQYICDNFQMLYAQYNHPEQDGNARLYGDLALRHIMAAMVFRIGQVVLLNSPSQRGVVAKDRSSDYFNRLTQLLSEYYRTERNVEFYAAKMNLTPKHLSRVVRTFSGKSVHQWIDEFVVLEIKNLLKHSELSIQQISYDLNFANPSFMGQYFKRITGKTPGEYRREL